MKRIVTGLMLALMFLVGTVTILGSGGATDSEGDTRQWISYQSSREKCRDWCYDRAEDVCEKVIFRYEAGVCTCDGSECD